MPGDLDDKIPDTDQQHLVHDFLDRRAVTGSQNFFIGLGLPEKVEHTLQRLLHEGWIVQASSSNNYAYQLSSKALQFLRVQFGLQSPFKVFQRRPDLSLHDATPFELVLELQGMGFRFKDKTKKSEDYFERGT